MTTPLTSRWDAARSLDDREAIVAYLEEAARDGDRKLMAAALDDVLRSLGAFSLSGMVGLSRTEIFEALGRDDNPRIGEILREIIESEDLLGE